jgi:mono/diheme cytochrome c family protein
MRLSLGVLIMAASVSFCQAIRRCIPLALVAVMVFTTACSTKVGTTTTSTPTALITPVGSKATSGAGTASVAITVRSGAGVTLSGKDSDGNGVALASFSWQQTGGPTLQVPPIGGTLLSLTSNTVEFTAPQVASDTVLKFQLTVTNALNVSSTATATVTVTAANDPDEFLVPSVVDNPSPPRRFVVAVAPPSSALAPDAPVCVSVNRSVTYTSRGNGVVTLALPALPNLQANAEWNPAVTAVGAGGSQPQLVAALQSTTNPRVVFDVPAFNDIELATMYTQNLNAQLVTSDLDSAVLNLSISATPGPCNGMTPDPATVSASTLALGIYAPGVATLAVAPGAAVPLTNGGSGGLDLTADTLLQAVNPPKASSVETLAGVQAYYAAIDPPWPGATVGATKSDLNTWLDDNCFDHTQSDFGTGAAGANGAHAVYTNNFDLGFGRDMYFIKCAANHTDANGNVTAHAGDMAAVVINYGSLEQTALKQLPILAVAMEYQGAGHSNGNCGTASSTCFTKFYIFGPNDRDGSYQRISSANFDRRGEKYAPGACLSCHGGSITDATYQTAGSENVDAAFMPWDVDALLFSDTDPAFTGNLISGAPYVSTLQKPNLLNLNALAWQTYQTPEMVLPAGGACSGASCINRFAAPIALLTQWYHWCNTANSQDPRNCPTARPYDDTGEPSSGDWPTDTPTGAPTTPAGAPNDLYHAVFAHNCRSCHTQNNIPNKQFATFKSFSGYFEGKLGSAANGIPNLAFNDARMPLARLTQDRFWVDYSGSTSAAQRLAQYINTDTNATFPNGASQIAMNATADAAGNTVVSPGAPVLVANVFEDVDTTGPTLDSPAAGTNSYPVDRFGGARVDLSSSLFAASYQSVLSQAGNTALVGADNGSPAFATSVAGAYLLQVTPTSASSKSTSPSSYTFDVNASPPTIAAACRAMSVPAALGVPKDVPLAVGSTCITLGLEPPGMYNVLQLAQLSGGNCPSPASSAWVGAGTIIGDVAGTWTASLSTAETYGVRLTFSGSATPNESVTLCFQITDVDGNDPQGTITFTVTDTLQAVNQTLNLWPPGVQPAGSPDTSYTIPFSTLASNDTIQPAGAQVSLVLVAPPTAGTTSLGGTVAPASLGPASVGSTAPFTYTPTALANAQPFLTCDINGNDINTPTSTCTFDTFAYYLLSADGTTRSATSATVSLNIQATTSFSRAANNSVYTILMNNCESCHNSSLAAGPGDPGHYWQVTLPPPGPPAPTPAQIAAAASATYASITGNNSAGSTGCNNWTRCQNNESTQASSSVGYTQQASLHYNVCVAPPPANNHYTTNFKLGASDCATLLQWILEGGHND